MGIKNKVIQRAKDLASLKQRIRDSLLGLDEEIKKYEGKLDEKERKIKRQLRIDLFKRSVEYIESHEATLVPKDRDKHESQKAQQDHQQENNK